MESVPQVLSHSDVQLIFFKLRPATIYPEKRVSRVLVPKFSYNRYPLHVFLLELAPYSICSVSGDGTNGSLRHFGGLNFKLASLDILKIWA